MPRLLALALLWSSSVSVAAEGPILLVQSVPKGLRGQAPVAAWVEKAAGRKTEDVTAVFSGLSAQLGMGIPTAPPRGWPAALATDFQQARAACEERLGSPSGRKEGNRAMLAVSGCAEKMKVALWTRYLQHRKADTVLHVDVASDQPSLRLAVTRVDVAANTKNRSIAQVPPAELKETLARLVAEALAGRGEQAPAELNPELPVSASGGALSAVPRAQLGLAAVAIPCTRGVPAAIELEGKSALGETLADRWKTSVAAAKIDAAPTVRCSLQATQEQQTSMMGTLDVVDALLVCGGRQHRAETALGFALRGKTAAEVLSERMLKNAFNSYCTQ